jgi:uroporphyrinogen decarboxylase
MVSTPEPLPAGTAQRTAAAPEPTMRERVWQAIRHIQPDRVPYHVTWTAPAQQKLARHYGVEDLDTAVGNHMAKYRARPPDGPRWLADRPGFWRDEWGVLWNRTVDRDIGVVETYQLPEPSLAGYVLPDPLDPQRYAGLPAFIADNAGRFRHVSMGFSLFERAWSLRGMSNLLVDMIEAPAFVDELFDALLAWNLAVIAETVKYDVDAILFGDDWGQQRGLIFGPRLWRRFVKPRIALMYAATRAAGKAVFIHCCGKVQELFPELIELGLDVFNPFQPDVMDPYAMKRSYGDQLAFYGGMSVQSTLPHGTPQQVRDEARRLMDEVGRGGGFILGPSHDMPGDIPLENMLSLIETLRDG